LKITNSGGESTGSNLVVSDTIAPTVTTGSADGSTVMVTFSENMNLAEITNKANYDLRSDGNNPPTTPVTIGNVTYSNKVATLSGITLVGLNNFKVTVTGVHDTQGTAIGGSNSFQGIVSSTDITPPTGTISVNSGAVYTNNANVTLNLTANDLSGVTQMRFSNDGITFSGTTSFAASTTWTLAGTEGTNMVWVQFKDTLGNWSSAVYKDSIWMQASRQEQSQ
jgi:hypothetical protein